MLTDVAFGPSTGTQWDGYDGKLYQPYNKRDKLGKPYDFVSTSVMNMPVKPVKVGVSKDTELFDEEEKGFAVVEDEFKKKLKTVKKPVQKQ